MSRTKWANIRNAFVQLQATLGKKNPIMARTRRAFQGPKWISIFFFHAKHINHLSLWVCVSVARFGLEGRGGTKDRKDVATLWTADVSW